MSIGGESPETGFSGHFSGNGHRIRIESEGVQNRNGLFASLSGAQVTDLELEVVQSNKGTGIAGALTSHAQNSRIEHVTVRQTVTAGTRRSAGLVGYSENSWIGDCKVLSSGPEYAEYGGLAYRNAGTIENCEYVTDGKSAKLSKFGGMTYENYGRIAECTATVQNSADSEAEPQHIVISGSNVGGIVGLLVGGTVTGCAANLNIEENPEKLALYGLGGIAGLAGTEEAELSRREDIVIENCRSYGGVLTGERWIGGILGGSQASLTQNLIILDCTVDLAAVRSSMTPENDPLGKGAHTIAGGITGLLQIKNTTKVSGCISNASVYGHHCIGGLLGGARYADAAGASEPYRLVVENSHVFGAEVAPSTDTGYACSGFVGVFERMSPEGETNWSTTFQGCTSYAEVRSNGTYCAGAFGFYSIVENVRGTDEYNIQNCHIYGSVFAKGNDIGGFFGYVNAENLKVADCTASGTVVAKGNDASYGTHVGGFVGRSIGAGTVFERCSASGDVTGRNGSGSFGGRMDGAVLKNCIGKGNVFGWYHSGGFIGYAVKDTVEDCTSYGNYTVNEADAAANMVGSFIGAVVNGGRITRCRSYGDLSGGVVNMGGFLGMILGVAAGDSVSITDCVSYGNATKRADVQGGGGGFVGRVEIVGSVSFTNCIAYGSVMTGGRSGGFIGYLFTKEGASFTNCHAYGDVLGEKWSGSEVGGFGGFIQGTGGRTAFTDCTAHGSVAHSADTPISNSDAGGFVGVLATEAKLLRCHSYAPAVVGDTNYTGGLIGSYYGDASGIPSGSVVQNCTYTAPGGIPMVGIRYGTAANADVVITETGNTLDTADYAGQNSRPSLTCTVTKGNGTDAVVTFSGAANIAGYVTELAVSTDGGKTYTQLVYTDIKRGYDGYLLVPLGGKAAGESKLTAGNFSFTVSSRSAVAAGTISVRVAFSDGYAKTFTA